MNTKIEYTKGETGKAKIIADILPPPSELVLRDGDGNQTPTNPSRPTAWAPQGEGKSENILTLRSELLRASKGRGK